MVGRDQPVPRGIRALPGHRQRHMGARPAGAPHVPRASAHPRTSPGRTSRSTPRTRRAPTTHATGALEASRSDLTEGAVGDTPVEFIDTWLSAPFHALGLLRPGLKQVAFASDPTTGDAGIDVIGGLTASVPTTSPVLFPGNGMVTNLTTLGPEVPDRRPRAGGHSCRSDSRSWCSSRPVRPPASAPRSPGPRGPSRVPRVRSAWSTPTRSTRRQRSMARPPRSCSRGHTWSSSSRAPRSSPAATTCRSQWRAPRRSRRRSPSHRTRRTWGHRLRPRRPGQRRSSAWRRRRPATGTGSPLPMARWRLSARPAHSARWPAGPRGAHHPHRCDDRRTGLLARRGGRRDLRLRRRRLLRLDGRPAAHAPVVDLAPTADGRGYWLVASDGGVFAFGDAQFDGSMGGQALNRPVVAMRPPPTGRRLLGGRPPTAGSSPSATPVLRLDGRQAARRPDRRHGAHPDGQGYWMVASDGGVFAFGDAGFIGSMGGPPLDAPIVGWRPTHDAAATGWWRPTAGCSPSATPFLGSLA